LLPQDPSTPPEPDPCRQLMEQLFDHDRVEQATGFLSERLRESAATWSRWAGDQREHLPSCDAEAGQAPNTINVMDVLRLAEKALAVARAHRTLDLSPERFSIEEMVRWLQARMAPLQADQAARADVLLAEQESLDGKISLFLAILEISRTGALRLAQKSPFTPILVFKTPVDRGCEWPRSSG